MKAKMISGYVVDDKGNPVKGAFVVVQSSDLPAKDIAIITNDMGVFRLELPGGDCCISASTRSGMKGVKKISKYTPSNITPKICVYY
ncbi:carboxypeptidase-like regulatory domain-containing protein [Pectobacterium versatile]|jgi:hypothetical protein|uniref:carboxypeptidase-like regulatory domain-containing protein n=1 Tax=Pectobacterium versatile TaxID=2488639 RepID=UPI002B24F025|nr:carboxypeptidase-like regulatory domain-containing protein [Pectobacterium versatile]